MDITKMISELRDELVVIDSAILALEQVARAVGNDEDDHRSGFPNQRHLPRTCEVPPGDGWPQHNGNDGRRGGAVSDTRVYAERGNKSGHGIG